MPYTEEKYENAIIQLFEEMGYTHAYGFDIDRDYKIPLYIDALTEALYRLNPTLPDYAIADALFKLQNFENGELVQKNAVFMDYLQNGIEIRYTDKGEERSAICYIVDYANTDNNSFVVANQWTFIENDEKRSDVLLFVNGLPVVLMELKSPSREETVYDGACYYDNYAFLCFICHEICHVLLFWIGFTPVSTRAFGDTEIKPFRSVEWQAKALTGEVMIPYDATKGMTSKEIVEKYHVTKQSADYRIKQDKKKK